MKRLSNALVILLILLSTFALTGCSCEDLFKVETVANNGSITLTIDQDVVPYLPYEEIPTFTLTFDGVINTTKNRTGEYEVIFTKNDDYEVSKIIAKLIDEYEQKGRVSYRLISEENIAETWMNKKIADTSTDSSETILTEKDYVKVKDSKIYNEIAYITLENGLQLTINYARIVDFENTTYYRWQKTESIRMVLHYPLMINKNANEEKEILILALPNAVIYNFDTTTKKLSVLIEDDKFLGSEYYSYEYVNSYEEDKDEYKQYYIDYFEGIEENGKVNFKYLGITYQVEFLEEYFVITFLK